MSTQRIETIKQTQTVSTAEFVKRTFFKTALITPEEKEIVMRDSTLDGAIHNIIEEQNVNVLNLVSSTFGVIYTELTKLDRYIAKVEENLEKLKNSTQEIDIKLKTTEKSNIPRQSMSLAQIDKEILDLKIKIEEHQNIIGDKKNPKEKAIKSIPEDEEFIVKFSQEKRAIMDTIEEKDIIEMTYLEAFTKPYHYEIFEIILQEIGKFNFVDKASRIIDEEASKKGSNALTLSEELRRNEIEKKKKELIFKNFKENCFNAWKFKNLFLALEGLNLVEKRDVDEMKIRLERIKNEGSASIIRGEEVIYVDESWEKLFEKFLKILKVLLFLTVGQKKIELTREKLKVIEKEEKFSSGVVSELKGKLELLEDIRRKMHTVGGSITETETHVTDEKISIERQETPEMIELRGLLKELHSMKANLQNSYYGYLTGIGNSLINPKTVHQLK